MVSPITSDEFEKLNSLLERESGIFLKPEQDYLMEVRLTDLAREYLCESFSDLYRVLLEKQNEVLPLMVDLMTTNETSWFRDPSLWNLLQKVIIKNAIEDMKAGKKHFFKIWSAVCSTGQEVYSLKMLIREMCIQAGKPGFEHRFSILATDISANSLFLAKNARYNFISMNRGLSEDRIANHFEKVSEHSWKLKGDLQSQVRFEQFNLKDPFEKHGVFDLVLVRNVMIYFRDEFRKKLIEKFAASLQPGAALILGASENLNRYTNKFIQQSFEGGIYFKLK